MNKYIFVAFLALAIITLAACKVPSSSASSSSQTSSTSGALYHKITAKQAKARIDSKEKILIVDVRTKEEFEEKHIEGAILIPNEKYRQQQA